ncbi:hypothetical protein PLICRDRAFT_318920 [Plicaturopsis crispa FD-325 SS-3]|nr:hypothetical protein PLICRDRAFT_318920 [Plicaturopsis crispa FD-325 SS-3]
MVAPCRTCDLARSASWTTGRSNSRHDDNMRRIHGPSRCPVECAFAGSNFPYWRFSFRTSCLALDVHDNGGREELASPSAGLIALSSRLQTHVQLFARDNIPDCHVALCDSKRGIPFSQVSASFRSLTSLVSSSKLDKIGRLSLCPSIALAITSHHHHRPPRTLG